MTLRWSGGPTASPVQIFLHAQRQPSVNALVSDFTPVPSSIAWNGVTSLTTNIDLPSDLAQGTYRVLTGLYDLTSMNRMALDTGPGVIVAKDPLSYQVGMLRVGADFLLGGVRLNAEVYSDAGESYGESWINSYETPAVQAQVREELVAVRQVTRMNTIAYFTGTGGDFAWPVPHPQQIRRLAMFINDANSVGLKVALFLSTHCIVSNATAGTYGPSNQQHVGGHVRGETVNGVQLYWDMAHCDSNNIEQAKAWYAAIIAGLDAPGTGVADPDGIAYVALSGHPYLPFSTEINLFSNGDPLMPFAKEYIANLVPYLHSMTKRPIGISTLSSGWLQPEHWFDYLDNILAAVPIAQWDIVDVTLRVGGNPAIIRQKVGASNAYKIVLSDFKMDDSFMSQAETIRYHADAVAQNGFRGWWIWQYKDAGNGSGIRAPGFAGVNGGWKADILKVFEEAIR